MALAVAYLRVLRKRKDESIKIETTVDRAAADARFPPMVLQPLCEALARPTLTAEEQARVRIPRPGNGTACVYALPPKW
jgi:LytS/YehU family sensor histidine kinase